MPEKKAAELCKNCQRFRYIHSWVAERIYDGDTPKNTEMFFGATFSLYQPGEQTNELPCDALSESDTFKDLFIRGIPFEKSDYCKTGRCLGLDTIENDSKEKKE